ESKITDLSSSCVSDGVVLIDPEQVKGKKVYVMLSCTFRYGRDDMDVLGMAFRRDIFLSSRQVYPPLQDKERSIHTKWVCVVISENACVFSQFPDNLPCSVCLHPGPTDVGKRCAVEFEVKAFCAENQDEKAQKSSVRLAIRKIQYALDKGGAAPSAETTCEFIMSDKPLHMRVSLEKEVITECFLCFSVTVEQVTNVVLYSNDKYIKTVAYEETTDTVPSGTSLKKVYTLCPLLDNNRERLGLALDGKLKHEDTNLASSMLKEILGMLVAYRVVVKCNAAG
uniref:S-arrestin n=1 Tax=Sinocyclocheilus anshuiensis TaxID=1608454 RepID=A0A671MR22_9TELE